MHKIEGQTKTRVASRFHLATVVFLLLAMASASLVGRLMNHGGGSEFQASQRLPIYLRVASIEWLLFAYLVFGIRRHGNSVRSVIDRRVAGARSWGPTIALGIGAAIAWMVIGAVIMSALRPTADDLRSIQSFLPHDPKEKIGFALMTLTAGFCEEFIYRGYLQQQFLALTQRMTPAIVLQAALFTILHVSLPWKYAVSAAAMALFLGALVAWKKTLIPPMLTHTLVNLLGLLTSSGSSG